MTALDTLREMRSDYARSDLRHQVVALDAAIAALEAGRSGEAGNQSARDQVADLLLTDPESGEPCHIVSSLRRERDGFQSFDVQSGPDAPKWRVEVRVLESGWQDANPAATMCSALTPSNADAARQDGTPTAPQQPTGRSGEAWDGLSVLIENTAAEYGTAYEGGREDGWSFSSEELHDFARSLIRDAAAPQQPPPVGVTDGNERLDDWANRVATQFDAMGESYDARQLRSLLAWAQTETEWHAQQLSLDPQTPAYPPAAMAASFRAGVNTGRMAPRPEFKDEAALAAFLDSLCETLDDGAFTGRKWEPAQRALAALSHQQPAPGVSSGSPSLPARWSSVVTWSEKYPAPVPSPAYTKAADPPHTIGSVEDADLLIPGETSSKLGDAASGEGLLALIGEYWCLAYAEGKEGRDHDTEDGAAQRKLAEIQSVIRRLTTTGQGDVERDWNMARHWIDRYAAGVDDEPQLDLIAQALGLPDPFGQQQEGQG